MKIFLYLALIFFLSLFFTFWPAHSFAAKPLVIKARVVSQNQTILRLKPGQPFTISALIQNIGKSTWKNSGTALVALNTSDEKQAKTIKSRFQNKNWKKWWRPASLSKNIKPGETATIKFAIQAPNETGRFTEYFSLTQAGFGFIDGGNFSLTVISFPEFNLTPPETPSVELEQNQTKTIQVQFINAGQISWDAKKFPLAVSVGDLKSLSGFTDSSWQDNQTPCVFKNDSTVKPKSIISCSIYFKAPDTPGSYRETFFVRAADLGEVKSSRFAVNFSVLSKTDAAAPRMVSGEPNIRVGLFSKTGETQFKANEILDLVDSNGTAVLTVNPNSLTKITPIDSSNFSITVGIQTVTLHSPVRFLPRDQTAITEITTFERHPAWNSTLNDNLFRGIIEFRLMPNSTVYWAIEEVALEEYLRGIGEVSDGDNPIYLKTMMIAARTYAAFLNLYRNKHKVEGFDVNMTTDQVYRGYNLELRSPNVTRAVLDTEGQLIIHSYAIDEKNPQGIIAASYSSGTDGKTRDWCKVWKCANPATDYPWAKSVPDPLGIIPNALTLSGNHMVGLSGKGARAMAQNGKTAEEILKYYYTGIEIKKLY